MNTNRIMSESRIPIPTLSLGACLVLLLRRSRLFLLQFPAAKKLEKLKQVVLKRFQTHLVVLYVQASYTVNGSDMFAQLHHVASIQVVKTVNEIITFK